MFNSATHNNYRNRVKKTSNLFSDDDPEEDDTNIEDLSMAAELLTYDNKPLKKWNDDPSKNQEALS